VVDQPVETLMALPQGHLQRVQGEIGAQVGGGLPAHDHAAVDVDDEGDVDEPRPGPHVGEVGHPQGVGTGGGEVALDQVGGPPAGLLHGDGGPLGLAAHHPRQAQFAHQPRHRATRHRDVFAAQLPPHLADPVHAEVLAVHPPDVLAQLGVA
jgi:hypothetical protein